MNTDGPAPRDSTSGDPASGAASGGPADDGAADGLEHALEDAARTLSELDDDELLARLAELLGDAKAPSWSAELAKASYGLRAVDAEIATLTSDSRLSAGAGMRAAAAPWLAVFDAAGLSVEIEIEPAQRPGSWRLVGQLAPAGPARIGIRRHDGAVSWTDADDRGRFSADQLPGGPLSLRCERSGQPVTDTEWIALG
jgi:hypothetical protein